MQTLDLIQEIQRLPLSKRFFVIEETLKSIKKEELSHQMDTDFDDEKELSFSALSVNEKSLAKDWLSTEDSRWDKIL